MQGMMIGIPLDVWGHKIESYGKMDSIPSALDSVGFGHAKKSTKNKSFSCCLTIKSTFMKNIQSACEKPTTFDTTILSYPP